MVNKCVYLYQYKTFIGYVTGRDDVCNKDIECMNHKILH